MNQTRHLTVRKALIEIGAPAARWFHEVHPIWKLKIVAARYAKDMLLATRLSELFAYLKENMNRRCNTPGCEATVAGHVRDCRMHSTAKRAGMLRAPSRTAIGAVARVVNGKAGRPGGVDRVFEKVRLIDRSATRLSVRRGLTALVAQGSLVRSGHNSRRRRRVGFRFAKAFTSRDK